MRAGIVRFIRPSSKLLAEGRPLPSFFIRRDEVTPETILELGRRVQSSNWNRWVHLANSIEAIKDEARSCDETLTYNDFHWTNLALTRNAAPIRAVVFDYHLLGIGLRYSDWRNVTGSQIRASFITAFGAVDEKERVLDSLLAPLYALVVAFRRTNFPSSGIRFMPGLKQVLALMCSGGSRFGPPAECRYQAGMTSRCRCFSGFCPSCGGTGTPRRSDALERLDRNLSPVFLISRLNHKPPALTCRDRSYTKRWAGLRWAHGLPIMCIAGNT